MREIVVTGLVPGFTRTRQLRVVDLGGGLVRTVDGGQTYRVCRSCQIAKRLSAYSGSGTCRSCRLKEERTWP